MDPLKLLQNILIVFVAVLIISLPVPTNRAKAQEDGSLPGQFVYVESGSRLFLVRGNVDEPILLMQAGKDTALSSPHFSKDGRYLAFCLMDNTAANAPDLFYLDTLTLGRTKVTANGSCSFDWSPDGKTLIYSPAVSMENASTQPNGIWSYSLRSGESKLLIPSDAPVIDPRWSPDGHTISYFGFCFECVGQFYTYNLNTGDKQEWSHEGTEDFIGPDVDWSPDGQSLIYDRMLWMYAPAGETYGLYLANSDGGTRQEVYSQAGHGSYFPIWSPDGKLVAFASLESFVIGNYMNVRGDLMTASPYGAQAQKLYSSAYEVYPQAWSPDGHYLLFTEPTSMPQGSVQQQQLVLLDAETGRLLWKESSSGGIAADWAPFPAADETPQPAIPRLAGHSGLLFVSPDYALAFYEPASGQMQKLTPSFSGTDFSVSPDARTVLFGNQIVSMQGQADGSITASITAATHPIDFPTLNWSPDGNNFGYVDHGVIWQADLSGNSWKQTEGDAPPGWSYDGRWMAFCDREGHLWVAETGKPADWILQQDHCQVSWSPTRSILAYASFPSRDFANQANGTAFLYDPISGETKEVAQNVSSVDWSPDGKLVSIQRVTGTGAGSYSFSISAVNPESGQELLIDEFNAEMYGNHGWIEQSNGYIVGKYKFQADLFNKEQLADILFDASHAGTSLLTGKGNEQSIQVGCQDMETNLYYPLAEMSLQTLPGVSASFSPNGSYILVSNDEVDKTTVWIASCSPDAPQQFETQALPDQQYFSPGSGWLVMEETSATGEQVPRIVLREMKSSQSKEISAGLQTGSAWFQMPDTPAVPATIASAAVIPAASQVPAGMASPVSELPGLINNRVAMFSILLWAAILIASTVLMLYLWRRWSVPPKAEKAPVVQPSDEQKTVPAAENELKSSTEELEQAFQSGVAQVRAGKASGGIAELTRVIHAEPDNDVAWFWLGIASARSKDYRSAERCFLQAKRFGHPEADKALEWLKGQKTNRHPE
jgi:Tol biopolymer transport system component